MPPKRYKKPDQDMPSAAIEVSGLSKTYPASGKNAPKIALDNLNLTIPRGSIFGLLGPNGAGKSTLINILAGLVTKSEGEAFVWGYDVVKEPRRARASIGVVPQELNLDSFFTPYELLEQQAGFYGVPKRERRTDEILAIMNLSDKAHAHAGAMSGGMRRRLMMAKAMVHNPPVLILDEPTAGVDVELRHGIWDYIRRLNENGTTILLTTHYLQEAEVLCDQIAILDKGFLVANDSKENLLARMDSKDVTVRLSREVPSLPEALTKLGWVLKTPSTLSLSYKPSETSLGQLLLSVQAYGFSIKDLSTDEPDIETLFLHLTKHDDAGEPAEAYA